MSNSNGESSKCFICEKRKNRKADLPSIVTPSEVNCSKSHRFCLNCIQIYSRIDAKCPVCGTDYSTITNVADRTVIEKNPIDAKKGSTSHVTDKEKDEYVQYLETITDISSDEETESKELIGSSKAEFRIRNRMKMLKRCFRCTGVNCESSECLSGHHAEEPIEEFHVGEYEWQEAPTDEKSSEKKLKREQTFEELFDECFEFAEKAIADES